MQDNQERGGKEYIRKIAYKPTMWSVYRCTRNDEDYTNYKEALNAATTEIGKYKISYEQKFACNIKNYITSFVCICRE